MAYDSHKIEDGHVYSKMVLRVEGKKRLKKQEQKRRQEEQKECILKDVGTTLQCKNKFSVQTTAALLFELPCVSPRRQRLHSALGRRLSAKRIRLVLCEPMKEQTSQERATEDEKKVIEAAEENSANFLFSNFPN